MYDSKLSLNVATGNSQITKKGKKTQKVSCFKNWNLGGHNKELLASREDGDPATDTRGVDNHQEGLKACLH